MDLKRAYNIQRHLDLLSNDGFDEYSIKGLLIDIRDYLPQSNLREICDSIAHPLRDKGGSWGKLSQCYWQLKYAPIQGTPRPVPLFPSEELSKEEYFALIRAIENTNADRITAEFGFDEKVLKNKVKAIYSKKNGSWALKKGQKPHKLLVKTLNVCIRQIEVRVLMTQEDMITEMIQAVKSLMEKFESLTFDINVINNKANDISLCILAFLQNVRFTLYDGTQAESIINIHQDNIGLNGLFPLSHFDKKFSVPLISSSIKYQSLNINEPPANQLPSFTVVRNRASMLEVKLIRDC
jgi:hypothetical protein